MPYSIVTKFHEDTMKDLESGHIMVPLATDISIVRKKAKITRAVLYFAQIFPLYVPFFKQAYKKAKIIRVVLYFAHYMLWFMLNL